MKRLTLCWLLLCPLVHADDWSSGETKIEMGAFGAELVYDAYSSRILRTRDFRERNPLGYKIGIPVDGAAVIGASWLLHRTHHDKLNRWLLRLSVGAEGANDIHQARWEFSPRY
jgi:hypothetical protein